MINSKAMDQHILYISARSPFARRVRILMEELSVPHEVVVLNVFEPPAWYYEVNPSGRVPVLELPNKERIIDSSFIQHYLHRNFSTHPLFTAAGGVSFAGKTNVTGHSLSITELVINYFLENLRPPGKQLPDDLQEYRRNIEKTVSHLAAQFTGPYYFGEELGYWDFDLGTALAYCDFRVGRTIVDSFPALRQYLNLLEQRPSFQKTKPVA